MTGDGGAFGDEGAAAVLDARAEEPAAAPPLRARALHDAAEGGGELAAFLDAPSPRIALEAWFGAERLATLSADRLRRMIDRDIAELDDVLARAADAVLHAPRFQALEAAWRGVRWLADGLGADGMSQIRLLDCRWAELARDLERAPEFDASHLFHLIYDEEFGMPGGVPYALLIGLYEIAHKPTRERPTDDVTALRALSRVCAAAFSPIVMGAAPALFGAERFGELELRQSLSNVLGDMEHRRLLSFAETADARFVSLVAPRVLLREPYSGRETGDCGFAYAERVRGDGRDELWGSGALAVARVCLRAFNDHRWLAAIRGTPADTLDGGVVAELPAPSFTTDSPATALKFPLEINLSAPLERDMAEAGLICLKRCKDTPFLAVYNLPTLHRPSRAYTTEVARSNAQLGAMLNYVLCVSRFAHYIKVIGREWIGSMKTAEECEIRLQTWLSSFTSAGERLSYDTKARFPLAEARIQVRDMAGAPGSYECTVHLKPHFQLDQAVSEFQLTTAIGGMSAAA